MKLLVNKINSTLEIFSKTSLILMFMFATYFIFPNTDIFAQTSRPTPTPRRDIPAVISRDDDTARTVVNTDDDDDLIESVDTDNIIKLPRENTVSKTKTDQDSTAKQKKMLLYLDLLTRTEQRAAALQTQLFDLIEKQNTISSKITQLEYQLRPESITSATALTGSLRPEDLREQRKKALDLEKSNAEAFLLQLDSRRSTLEENARKADALVEKIRQRFDRIIDEALTEEDELF